MSSNTDSTNNRRGNPATRSDIPITYCGGTQCSDQGHPDRTGTNPEVQLDQSEEEFWEEFQDELDESQIEMLRAFPHLQRYVRYEMPNTREWLEKNHFLAFWREAVRFHKLRVPIYLTGSEFSEDGTITFYYASMREEPEVNDGSYITGILYMRDLEKSSAVVHYRDSAGNSCQCLRFGSVWSMQYYHTST